MEVTSCIDGRIRLRDPGLKRSSLAEAVRERLRDLPEIRSVRLNRRTGSLLIIFDRIRTTVRKVLSALAGIFGLPVREESSGGGAKGNPLSANARSYFTRRRAVNLGMLASLIVSIGGAIAGTEGLHIAVGVLFVALVGIHISGKLRHLFT